MGVNIISSENTRGFISQSQIFTQFFSTALCTQCYLSIRLRDSLHSRPYFAVSVPSPNTAGEIPTYIKLLEIDFFALSSPSCSVFH